MLKAQYAVEEFGAENIAVLYTEDEVGLEGIEGVQKGLQKNGQRRCTF